MRRHEPQQAVLNAIRVLVLVDQHVSEPPLGEVPTTLGAFEKLDPAYEQVVEVRGSLRVEHALITKRDVLDDLAKAAVS